MPRIKGWELAFKSNRSIVWELRRPITVKKAGRNKYLAKFKRETLLLRVIRIGEGRNYVVIFTDTYDVHHLFKTRIKSEAVKFATNWMKKHPKG